MRRFLLLTLGTLLVAAPPAAVVHGGGCNYSAEQKKFVTDYPNQMAWSVAQVPRGP